MQRRTRCSGPGEPCPRTGLSGVSNFPHRLSGFAGRDLAAATHLCLALSPGLPWGGYSKAVALHLGCFASQGTLGYIFGTTQGCCCTPYYPCGPQTARTPHAHLWAHRAPSPVWPAQDGQPQGWVQGPGDPLRSALLATSLLRQWAPGPGQLDNRGNGPTPALSEGCKGRVTVSRAASCSQARHFYFTLKSLPEGNANPRSSALMVLFTEPLQL